MTKNTNSIFHASQLTMSLLQFSSSRVTERSGNERTDLRIQFFRTPKFLELLHSNCVDSLLCVTLQLSDSEQKMGNKVVTFTDQQLDDYQVSTLQLLLI